MDFYFVSNEECLTRSPQSGGLGMTAEDIKAVKVWQKDMKYQFHFHTGTHGDPCVYVKVGGSTSYNKPCIWLMGANEHGTRGDFPADAETVVVANTELFLNAWKAFNGQLGDVGAVQNNNNAMSFACQGCGKKYGPYDSLIELGLALNSYPAKCPKCGSTVTQTV